MVALALDDMEQWLFSASADKVKPPSKVSSRCQAIKVYDLKHQRMQCEASMSGFLESRFIWSGSLRDLNGINMNTNI